MSKADVKPPHREKPSRWIEQYFPIKGAAGNVKAATVFVIEVGSKTVIRKAASGRSIVLRPEILDC